MRKIYKYEYSWHYIYHDHIKKQLNLNNGKIIIYKKLNTKQTRMTGPYMYIQTHILNHRNDPRLSIIKITGY